MIQSHTLAYEVKLGLSTLTGLFWRFGTLRDVPRKSSMLRESQKHLNFQEPKVRFAPD